MIKNSSNMNSDEIKKWRKYYFSLAPEVLHHHLMYRNVPVFIDDVNKSKDLVLRLYGKMNEFLIFDVDNYYIEQKVWNYIIFLKNKVNVQHSRYELSEYKKTIFALRYIIWSFYSGKVLIRKYEPLLVDNVETFFQFKLWQNTELFFRKELEDGIKFDSYKFFAGLMDNIRFNPEYSRKYINR